MCQAVWQRHLSPAKCPGPLVCGETAASCQGNDFLCPIKAKRKWRWKSVQKVEIRTVAEQFSFENMTIAQGTGTKWQILFPRVMGSGAKSCCIPAPWNVSWQVEAAPVSSAVSPAQVLSALLPPAARAEEQKPPALTCCYEQHQARFWSQLEVLLGNLSQLSWFPVPKQLQGPEPCLTGSICSPPQRLGFFCSPHSHSSLLRPARWLSLRLSSAPATHGSVTTYLYSI